MRENMPIMGSMIVSRIPMAMIAPHERQARHNHGGQGLEMLASRGGLSCCEAIAILLDRSWHRMKQDEADRTLINMVREWRAASPAPAQEAGRVETGGEDDR